MALNPISTNSRNEDYQKPSILYICGGSTESNPYFQQLVKWRRNRDILYILLIPQILEEVALQQSKIIFRVQMNWDTPPEFVTLIGDDGGTYNIEFHIQSMILVTMVKEITRILS